MRNTAAPYMDKLTGKRVSKPTGRTVPRAVVEELKQHLMMSATVAIDSHIGYECLVGLLTEACSSYQQLTEEVSSYQQHLYAMTTMKTGMVQ